MKLKARRKDGSEIIPEDFPDEKHRFFIFDKYDLEDYYFETVEDRDSFFKLLIKDCYYDNGAGDGWYTEAIEQIIAGEITHIANAVNVIKRPPDSELGAYCVDCDEKAEGCQNDCHDYHYDEDGNDWSGDHDHICDYALVPLREPLSDGLVCPGICK
mgnify:CR=1 FL=1